MWYFSSYFFHPVAMVEDLKLQQDAWYSVIIPNDPLGLWGGEHSWMLYVKRLSLHCMTSNQLGISFAPLHWRVCIEKAKALYLLEKFHWSSDPAGQLARPQDATCHWGQVPANRRVQFLFHVKSGDIFNVFAIVLQQLLIPLINAKIWDAQPVFWRRQIIRILLFKGLI